MLAVLHALLAMQGLPAITCPSAGADHANLLLHVCLVGKFGERTLHLNLIPFLQSCSVSETTLYGTQLLSGCLDAHPGGA